MSKEVRADLHNVRVQFDHGNPITLDLKGCGSLYIHPGKEYFFYNAPIKFVDYMVQLKRLGITYRLTPDKKGCYMAIDLINFESKDPRNILGGIRNSIQEKTNKADTEIEIVSDDTEIEIVSDDTESVLVEPVKEVESVKEVEPVSVENIEDAREKAEEKEEVEEKYSKDKLSKLNKMELIEYAHKLGYTGVTDLLTKKEIIQKISE